jgi:hypothetical protein
LIRQRKKAGETWKLRSIFFCRSASVFEKPRKRGRLGRQSRHAGGTPAFPAMQIEKELCG